MAWFNYHRLLESIGYITKAEAVANYYQQLAKLATAEVTLLKPNGLFQARGDLEELW